jgi:hypothetical protein
LLIGDECVVQARISREAASQNQKLRIARPMGQPFCCIERPQCRHYTGLFSGICMRLNLTSEMFRELTHLTVGILAFYHAIGDLLQAYIGKAIVPLVPPLLRHTNGMRGPVRLEPARSHGGT